MNNNKKRVGTNKKLNLHSPTSPYNTGNCDHNYVWFTSLLDNPICGPICAVDSNQNEHLDGIKEQTIHPGKGRVVLPSGPLSTIHFSYQFQSQQMGHKTKSSGRDQESRTSATASKQKGSKSTQPSTGAGKQKSSKSAQLSSATTREKGRKPAQPVKNDEDQGHAKRTKDVDIYEPDFFKLPLAERSKLLRAQRNREAAHRSRTKNKTRQAQLEDDSRQQLKLCNELSSLADYLLPGLDQANGK